MSAHTFYTCNMKKLCLQSIVLLFCSVASAQVHLPKIFGDSMVLQRGKPIPVWGWADKNEKITVQFNRQVKNTVSGADGKWKLKLDPESAGGPYQLIIKGKNTVVVNNVLVGEVWVCSGQSNMEFAVSGVINAASEIQQSNNPDIRHIYIPKAISGEPKDDITGNSNWKAATPANTGSFTAVGYFFAKELFKTLHVPIGLIHTSWGGTDVETWTSHDAFEKSEEFKEMISTVPRVSLDSIARIRKSEILAKLQLLQGGLPAPGLVDSWRDLGFDDSHWPRMTVPKLWEQQSLADFDGIVWFRKTIILSAAEAAKPAVLQLGMIDDNDDAYVNGIKVGATKAYNVKRAYKIPAGILKEGKNSIAVRVEDTGGGGGFYGDAAEVKIVFADQSSSLAGEWAYKVESVHEASLSMNPNAYPSLLYNAMIHPLINFGIKGAIWYQGESNAGRAFQYRKAFPLLITDWRQHWAQGNFPFYFVQLAGFNSANGNSVSGSTWAELREAQTLTLSLPNTGMAVTTDIGESKDIHPKNKQDVGKRLALVALDHTYGKKNVYSGPTFQSMKIEAEKIRIHFNHTGTGLDSRNADHSIRGFEIAGADQQFHPAKAIIEGDQIIVYAAGVKNPIAVRYAWADDTGDVTLCNKEGLPAVPFRTDEWNTITKKTKYKISQ